MIQNPNTHLFSMYNKVKPILPPNVFIELPKTVFEFKIDTPVRLSHFLSQCAHESGNWRFVEENLNYSKEALMSVFRRYFPDERTASEYARKPQKIANRVYSNRMGNGSPETNDGWNYRGRGYIQLTGRDNYSRFNRFVPEDVIQFPELVSQRYALTSAGWFWSVNDLNRLADNGSSEDVVRQITRRINGGFNGLDDRLRKFNQYYTILTK